jgi:hypothetical protein
MASPMFESLAISVELRDVSIKASPLIYILIIQLIILFTIELLTLLTSELVFNSFV